MLCPQPGPNGHARHADEKPRQNLNGVAAPSVQHEFADYGVCEAGPRWQMKSCCAALTLPARAGYKKGEAALGYACDAFGGDAQRRASWEGSLGDHARRSLDRRWPAHTVLTCEAIHGVTSRHATLRTGPPAACMTEQTLGEAQQCRTLVTKLNTKADTVPD